MDVFCRANGYIKKSGSWYRRQPESIAVINLQRSQYSLAYYVNVALWLVALGDSVAPKEHECHVRTRLNRLVIDPIALTSALNLDRLCQERIPTLLRALSLADGLLGACGSLAGCRQQPGRQLVDRAIVRTGAQELLADHA